MRWWSGVATLLLVFAAGCGAAPARSDAAPGGDAPSLDASPVDGAPGPVAVITKSRECCDDSPPGTLVAGVSVYAVQPAGQAGPSGTTDANGHVVLDGVEPGASITAVYRAFDPVGAQPHVQLVTVLAVRPGDTITLGEEFRYVPGGNNQGTMTATFPAYPSATDYYVTSLCNGNSGHASPLSFPEFCTLPTSNILFEALDDSANPVAAGVVRDVSYTDGQTAALAAWTPTPPGGFQVSISGLAADVDMAIFGAALELDGTGSIPRSSMGVTVSGGAASAAMPIPGGGDRTFAIATLLGDPAYGGQTIMTSVGATAVSCAFPAPGLPRIGARQLDTVDQTISWSQVGSGSYDAAFATMEWQRTDPMTATTTLYDWNVLLPPGQPSFHWGTPIAALAPDVPAAGDTFVSFHVQLVDLANATSYDAVRGIPEWHWQSPAIATANGEEIGVSSVASEAGSSPTGP